MRASEVAHLKFSDIDWRNGGISVCGKSRRQESLPLPQEVGNAILLYVNQGRPSLQTPEVFTTVLAPFHPLTRAAVTHIVRAALRRAGIKAPINGAHVFAIPPPWPCSVKVHPWPASVQCFDIAIQ